MAEKPQFFQVPVCDLKLYENNPRKHSKEQIAKLCESIKQFGFVKPITIDEHKQIITGHACFEAAKKLQLEAIPCVSHSHLSEVQKRAFRIADNKLAEHSEWDSELLIVEFECLLEMDYELEFTGFYTEEIDSLMIQPSNLQNEIVPQIQTEEATTRKGDVWCLGQHKIICGDALNEGVYGLLLEKNKASAIFTDPPYNVPVNGHICGNGKKKHREFPDASGEMNEEQFTNFLKQFMQLSSSRLKDGSLFYCCMDWRHTYEIETAARQSNLEQINLCIWNKNNGGMGSFYRSKHELIYLFKVGKGKHTNNVNLGKNGWYRTNVWDYPAASKTGDNSDISIHPTVKPVQLVADAIRDCTKQGEIILDPFLGSGTSLLAAEKTKRVCYAIEKDPLYVDLAIRRWQKETECQATNLLTGKTFNSQEISHDA